jgi:mannose-1-phosphate guanylyltransferase
VQALILAGGQGTRLRPLTVNVPKPIVSLVDQPFITYMFEWLCRHGVDDIVMSCGFLANGVRSQLGDGDRFGVRLRYIEEPMPLGTGGALKYAESLLDERFFMLNGDVLTDIDLTAQLAQHEATTARATLALIAVEDPSAYGLVRRRVDLSVTDFIEKPGPEQQIDTTLVNAGAYIIEREILGDMAPPGTPISIERDVFPKLIGHGLYGYEASGYWLDIGTPKRYLQATFDILQGNVTTEIGARLAASGMRLVQDAHVAGRVVAPAVIGEGCEISEGAIVGGRVVLGKGVRIGEGARVESSVLLDGAVVGPRSVISGSVIGSGAEVGARCHVQDGAVIGERVRLGADNTLAAGVRIFPDVNLPDGAIRF